MTWQKAAVVIGVLAGIPAIVGGSYVGWTWAVNQTVEDRFDNLNVLAIKAERELKAQKKQHEADIEIVGQSLSWIQWETFHRRLLNGGRLSFDQCKRYRALSKRFGMRPLPCRLR